MVRRIEWVIVIFFVIFRYRVVFFNSFFLSILSFILFSIRFFWVAVSINRTMLGLFVVIMYLGRIIVLFSYAFILKDVKISFTTTVLHIALVGVLFLFLELERAFILVNLDLTEVYYIRSSVLGYRGVLLYCVLRSCLSLCLGAKVF